jgi:hypothetical protein
MLTMRPQLLRLHARQARRAGVEGAGQVDGDDGVPAVDRKVLDVGHMLDAGVVDQHVHAAKGLGRKGHHGFDLGRLAHVGAVVGRLHAQRFDCGLGAHHVAKAVEHDVGALARQAQGHAQADAAGGTGDECGLALEAHLVSPECGWVKGSP